MLSTTAMLSLPPLALYIHMPWCVKKCPYCDFNSHRAPDALPVDAYVDALIADLEQDLPWVWGRTLHSIFIGGGTPSLFAPSAISRLLDAVSARLRVAPAAEITLEANPGTVEHGPFAGYRAAGVNRVSLGVQSFDDGMLAAIGRIHGGDEARRAVDKVREGGIDNLNLDLMYALPRQSSEQALADVDAAIALAPEHISHYQLTLEPNTLFHAQPPPLPDDDSAWNMQEACQERLAEGGYAQYEISAYAKGDRRSQHNLNYWRFGDYLGIGAGAHGKITLPGENRVLRTWKVKHPRHYLDSAAGPERLGAVSTVASDQLPFEFMLNALRLGEGFAWTDFEARTGLVRDDITSPMRESIGRGWLTDDGRRVQPTELGRRFLNDTIAVFLP
jgi:putative oxygen-independent coproporphyrinogen III oxidase